MRTAFLATLALLAFLILPSVWGLTPSRSYAWTFQEGNRVPNWSFENSLEFWFENAQSGVTASSRHKLASAKTGSFVGMVSRPSAIASVSHPLASVPIPIPQAAASYTLSFYYHTSGSLSGSIRPVVTWHAARGGGGATDLFGANLATSAGWTLYTWSFSVPELAQSVGLVLAEFTTNATGTLYFDDVVLEEGSLSSAEVQKHRQRIAESVAFSDAWGRTLQSQVKIAATGGKYLVAGTGFDAFARPETTYLATPYTQSSPAFQNALLPGAQGFYNTSGPFNAKGFPFSRVQYAAEPTGRVVESTSADSAWQFGKGHTVKQGFAMVNTTDIPADIENPPVNNAESIYLLSWVRSEDSAYTLTWKDKLGQTVRSVRNVTRSSSGANSWKWAVTRYEYSAAGQLTRTLTPLDDSAGTQHFAEVSQHDAQGRLLGATTPDRGLKKFWYNRAGQVRYSQDEEQRAAGEYTYFEYDAWGRPMSQGIQVATSLPQDSVDKLVYSQGTKIEQIGYIYDDTSSFQARTGFTLQEILGTWKSNIDLKNLPGRLFCKYNRNLDNTAPKFTAKEKFVADFHSYNSRGLLGWQVKYLGAIKDAQKRLQDVWYDYDRQGRMTGFVHYASLGETTIANAETYSYDFLGRVDTLRGDGGRMLARYRYADWGPIERVTFGGLASGDSALEVDQFYHSQGGVREIRARARYGASHKTVFQQFLGYEKKGFDVGGVPGLLAPKFDGTIAQQVYKYTSDMNALKPVRAVNYGYDGLGRMRSAQGYWNSNAIPLDGNEDILGGALSLTGTDSLSSRFDYDLNGRIKGQRTGGVSAGDSARYMYQTHSYKLDRVTGKLTPGSTRNLSPTSTLVYDLNGALLKDQSKRLGITYGWDGLPVAFTVDSAVSRGELRCCQYKPGRQPRSFRLRYPSLSQYNFYDADGNRVSRVEVESKRKAGKLRTRSTHYAYMQAGMLKEWREEYRLLGKVKASKATVSIVGGGSIIGRFREDGRPEFFVKNHLGSTLLTVDDRARYSDGRALDYLSFGSHKDLKINGADPLTQKWQGKEYENATRLYYFGARWYDPELGLWNSPDPGDQYFNPYSYVGGNVPNMVDPGGECGVYVAGVQGGPDRKSFPGMVQSTGYNIFPAPVGYPADIGAVAFHDPGSWESTVSDLRRAKSSCEDGERFEIHAHSGGGNRTAFATIFHPSARPEDAYFYASPVTPGFKTIMRFEGVKTHERYGVMDPVSWMAAFYDLIDPDPVLASVFNGEISPGVAAAIAIINPLSMLTPNPIHKLGVLNPDNWYLAGHLGVKSKSERSVWGSIEDHPIASSVVASNFSLLGPVTSAFYTPILVGGALMNFGQTTLGGPIGAASIISQDIFRGDGASGKANRVLGWYLGYRPAEKLWDSIFD